MKKLKELSELLNRDDVRSKIIKDAAFFDQFMTIMIGMYFCSSERTIEFYMLIGDRLSFNDKVTILNKIQYEKKYKSLECLNTLKKVQRLRNLLAHNHYILHFDKIFRDKELIEFVSGYPESYDKAVTLARYQLRRLASTKEFLKYQSKEQKA